MGRIIPYMMENKKCMKPPTRLMFGKVKTRQHRGVHKWEGVPQNGWFILEILWNWMIWGYFYISNHHNLGDWALKKKTRTCCGETCETSWADDLLASGDTNSWFSWILHIQWMLLSSIGSHWSFGHATVHIIPNHRRGCTTSQHHINCLLGSQQPIIETINLHGSLVILVQQAPSKNKHTLW